MLEVNKNNYREVINRLLGSIGGQVKIIDSRNVAILYGVEHKELLRVVKKMRKLLIDGGYTEEELNIMFQDPNNGAKIRISNFLITKSGFLLLMNFMGSPKDKQRRDLIGSINIYIIERMRLLQRILTGYEKSVIKNMTENIKEYRVLLTDTIRIYSRGVNGGKVFNEGKIYSTMTKTVYKTLGIDGKFQKGWRNRFTPELLGLIGNAELLLANIIISSGIVPSTLRLDNLDIINKRFRREFELREDPKYVEKVVGLFVKSERK